ncbi:MAG TPA: hypothetical protein VGO47_12135, partial [Chlamydiales bacterium]|nr:hypothetical protein [Chlamydiales bacterium]
MYNLIDAEDTDNLQGTFGYGFAVAADVDRWICVGNQSSSRVRYEGDISGSLPVPNATPGPFVYDLSAKHVRFSSMAQLSLDEDSWNVILQPEFRHGRGRISSLISIQPGPSTVLSYPGGEFQLQRGHAVHLKAISVKYDSDNLVRIHKNGNHNNSILWEEGPGLHSPGEILTYSPGGKLCIISESRIVYDFTPYIPFEALSGREVPAIVFSDNNPYVSVATFGSSLLFASSYSFPQNRGFLVGQVVCRSRPYGNHHWTLLYTLSPYGQYVVLRSKQPNIMI